MVNLFETKVNTKVTTFHCHTYISKHIPMGYNKRIRIHTVANPTHKNTGDIEVLEVYDAHKLDM